MEQRRAPWVAAAGVAAVLALPAGLRMVSAGGPQPAAEEVTALALAAPAAAEEEAPRNPLLVPGATLGSAEALARPLTEAEMEAMARALDELDTRHADDLVSVIAKAAEQYPHASPSLLLSIAHTETRGKVLAVSPAGAAGLAQATPAAYLLEGLDGPVYITNQYLIGTRAYIMKKPLGDAVEIASRLLEREIGLAEARSLLAKAKELRQVGMDELEALMPRAPEVFAQRVRAADAYNAETFAELERLLDRGAPRARLERFRDRVRKEYRLLLRLQEEGWKLYARQLARERDRVLREHYGQEPEVVIGERPYEAGEVLGRELDTRFSPTQMAEFLSRHLATKRQQALGLGVADEEVEAWTAALYNGGLVNVTRMRAGLASVGETERYMEKVPELRARLDDAMALAAE